MIIRVPRNVENIVLLFRIPIQSNNHPNVDEDALRAIHPRERPHNGINSPLCDPSNPPVDNPSRRFGNRPEVVANAQSNFGTQEESFSGIHGIETKLGTRETVASLRDEIWSRPQDGLMILIGYLRIGTAMAKNTGNRRFRCVDFEGSGVDLRMGSGRSRECLGTLRQATSNGSWTYGPTRRSSLLRWFENLAKQLQSAEKQLII
jgi:hypothetical protein